MFAKAKIASVFPAVLVFFILAVAPALAADYDLGFSAADIYFSKTTLIAGDQVRIYAKVHNVGGLDITGYVSFFSGINLIGTSQAVSVLPGSSDDVFVDFTVPQSSFNVLAKIQGTQPEDQNASNNETQSALITPEHDTDGDGTVDSQDLDDDNDGLPDNQENENTCPYLLKADSDNDGVDDSHDAFACNLAETLDTDGDGTGNNADIDDDNDGWSDVQEQSHGTDPLRADTDGDGVNDAQDVYPLDATKNREERNIFQPPPVENNTPVTEPAVNPQTEQPSADVQALTEELKNIIESPIAPEPEAEVESEQAVVSASAGSAPAFFRLHNWLLWLIVGIILVCLSIVIILFKDKIFASATAPVSKLPLRLAEKSKPQLVSQPQNFSSQTILETKPVRPSSHVIDLKKMKKQ